MDAPRWHRVQEVFHAVADLDPAQRPLVLADLCAGDADLMAEVVRLVDADAAAVPMLEKGLAHTAHAVLEPHDVLPTEHFGPYRVTGWLGEGGMGVVYRGVRDDLGSVAAIKVLRDAQLSPARRERFALEQRTLARLNHPAIATLHDADVQPGGTPWFAMEYVDGVPVTTWCHEQRAPLAARLRLFRAICEAVQHAHGHLIVHRDLKPSNILVRPDGSVKLLDFGIAKPLDALSAAEVTGVGLRFLTPAYAAPEQFRDEPVGIHTDIYALGVVLYELLTGRLPFDLADRTPAGAAAIVVSTEPDKPSVAAATSEGHASLARRSEWADLDVLCQTAMHKAPARRYPTVNALIRDLDHFLAREPLEARPDSIGYRIDRFVRRHRGPVTAAAAALVFVVALSAFYTTGLARARNAAVAESERTQRIQRLLVSLFEGGDDAAGPADSLRVITLVDRGVQEARSLTAEPVVQAELFETLGSVLVKLGHLDRADTLLRSALAQRRGLFGADHALVAQSLLALGQLRAEQAQLDSAERLVREGQAMTARNVAPDHPQVAGSSQALGQVLELRGNYEEALTAYGEAERLRSASGVATPELGASITGLANAHFYLGNYAAADSLTRRALAVSRQVYGATHPHIAEDLINLGAIQFEQGYYVAAESLYREALVINRGWYGLEHHVTASNFTMLGRVLRAREQWNEADSLLRRALTIQERVFGPVHPRVASALNDIASVALARERYADAADQYRRVVDIYRQVYGGKHYYIGIGLANLASVWMAQGENARAEAGFREALAMYAQTLPANHINVGITTIKLGRTLLRQRRFADAAATSARGYDIVSRQASPAVSWLRNARLDLVAAYDSLGTPDKAARYRAELADTSAAAARP